MIDVNIDWQHPIPQQFVDFVGGQKRTRRSWRRWQKPSTRGLHPIHCRRGYHGWWEFEDEDNDYSWLFIILRDSKRDVKRNSLGCCWQENFDNKVEFGLLLEVDICRVWKPKAAVANIKWCHVTSLESNLAKRVCRVRNMLQIGFRHVTSQKTSSVPWVRRQGKLKLWQPGGS